MELSGLEFHSRFLKLQSEQKWIPFMDSGQLEPDCCKKKKKKSSFEYVFILKMEQNMNVKLRFSYL